MNVPNHIAIILDGNGRWAKAKGMPRSYGHVKGCANLETVCDYMKELGVKYVTVYAFSTENWKRSREEVDGLMKKLSSTILVGEESGRLDVMLDSIAETLEADAEQATKRMVTLLEPILIIFMALIVGCIMIGVMLPIYQSYSAIENA